ncbi:hypothetical protein [Aequorivita sp. Q41]|uniref:hypothetical protein n=1 Tax=Aequorivita sp. Q41 TaxID=3153300 RepID=UPI003241E57B
MILLVRPQLLRKNFNGMTVWPFVIIKHQGLKKDVVFINHECIHLKQQAELLVVFFYLWYGIEFLFRWVQFKNRFEAYRNISFEREAYFFEKDTAYLKTRNAFGFMQFLK